MRESIEIVVIEDSRRAGGISLAVVISFLLHAGFIAWFVLTYRPAVKPAASVPMTRYVELIKQNPRQFTEAPGRKVDSAPLNALMSDANRRAAMPEPTGMERTLRPGNEPGFYSPSTNPAPRGPRPSQASPQVAAQQQQSQIASAQSPATPSDRLVYRERSARASAGEINWSSAIREVGKVAALGGGDGLNLTGFDGGERGFAEQGPLSFETSWFDWGEYQQTLVSRIRVNWEANMPALLHTGLPGVVTIRFTIHRDGRITDVTILKTSEIPPYDFAAEKAIELSGPLPPLPAGFPNPTERVIATFYYNKRRTG